jgi:hypothetical protein
LAASLDRDLVPEDARSVIKSSDLLPRDLLLSDRD